MKRHIILSIVFCMNFSHYGYGETLPASATDAINASVSTAINERKYWRMLEEDGWEVVEQSTKDIPISERLREELYYRKTLEYMGFLIINRRYEEATRLSKQHPQWQNCEHIHWLWQSLLNEVSTGYGPNSQRRYDELLETCPAHALTTTKKMLSWINRSAIEDILARYGASRYVDEFALAAFKEDYLLSSLEQPKPTLKTLQEIGRITTKRQSGQLAEALGWKYLDIQRPDLAMFWFESAIEWAGETELRVRGILYSLSVQAKRTLQHYEKKFPELKLSTREYNDQVCRQPPLAATCLVLLNSLSRALSPELASLRAWKLYELKRVFSAMLAFEEVLAEIPLNHRRWEITQYGYVLTLIQAGFHQKALVQAEFIQNSQNREALNKRWMAEAIYQFYHQGQYSQALLLLDQHDSQYGLDIALLEIKAWSLHHTNKTIAAKEIFHQLTTIFPFDENITVAYELLKCLSSGTRENC
ncbi:hypothetical protein [Vibrio caribbeanicus]|uniref:TPR repeat-containing protein n=1 Tax=Vibrio caribbeanicus ATCC BAA-2122 TaxID=796620 RepID=E3BK55_9VIBR|nr:hypothetical protein [Vibrio caribbeanicus]EFP96440.1 hypothetical protein VIBC2010_04659 [Vibrio caribbeanicus ATCC BAA-2122]